MESDKMDVLMSSIFSNINYAFLMEYLKEKNA